jgi:uroporphyrin-III C-methyltransferase/precorrin-2 dehydrogenase/sirohydrochlorin ferrochelatase
LYLLRLLSGVCIRPLRQPSRFFAVEHQPLNSRTILNESGPGGAPLSRAFLLMADLLPVFLTLAGRRVVLVGGGGVAASKLQSLLAAGADVTVVSPEVRSEIESASVTIARRRFTPADLDEAWLAVAAAPPEVNQQVAAAAAERRLFVNAVDDPAHATAYLGGVVRRDGVTVAISTNGHAPGLAGLLREALDAVLPRDLGEWMEVARRERLHWRRDGVAMAKRRPLLLRALNRLYGGSAEAPGPDSRAARPPSAGSVVAAFHGDGSRE